MMGNSQATDRPDDLCCQGGTFDGPGRVGEPDRVRGCGSARRIGSGRLSFLVFVSLMDLISRVWVTGTLHPPVLRARIRAFQVARTSR